MSRNENALKNRVALLTVCIGMGISAFQLHGTESLPGTRMRSGGGFPSESPGDTAWWTPRPQPVIPEAGNPAVLCWAETTTRQYMRTVFKPLSLW